MYYIGGQASLVHDLEMCEKKWLGYCIDININLNLELKLKPLPGPLLYYNKMLEINYLGEGNFKNYSQ